MPTENEALSDAVSTLDAPPPPDAPSESKVRMPKRRMARVTVNAAKPDLASLAAEYGFEEPASPDDTQLEAPAPKTAAVATPETPVKPEHDPRMVDLARDFGLDDSEINGFTPSELGAVVFGMRRQSKVQPWTNEPAPKPVAETVPESPAVEPDLSHLDPELAKLLTNQTKLILDLQKQLVETRKEIAPVRQSQEQQAAAEYGAKVDRVFDDLGNEAMFGKGQYTKDAARRRKAVHDSLMTDPIPGLSLPEAIKARARQFFGEPAPAAEPTEAERQKEWNNGVLGTPTSRYSPEPKGREKAEKSVAAWLAESGRGRTRTAAPAVVPPKRTNADDGLVSVPD